MIDMGEKHLSLGKNCYLTIFVCADSRYTIIHAHKTKNEVLTLLLQVLARLPKQPRILRTD